MFKIVVVLCFWLAMPTPGSAEPFTFTTLAGNAGYGSADGSGGGARFYYPQGVAADNLGNVYVADTQNSTIRKIDPVGVVSTLAGVVGTPGTTDTSAGVAKFDHPLGVAVDAAGNVYVADTRNSTIRMITPLGIVTTLAGSPGVQGSTNGINGQARFKLPGAVAVDASNNVYVADTYNSTIRKLAPSGTNWLVTTIAGLAGSNTNVDGTNTSARFHQPSGIAVDANRNLYVADTINNAIRKISPAGSNWVTTSLVNLILPRSVAVDGSGNVYVADSTTNTVRKLTLAGTNWTVTLVAGSSLGFAGSADGTNISARFNDPSGVASTTNGTLFVADTLNHTIRKITPAGVVSILAGAAGGSGNADGSQSQAGFNGPQGVACDGAKNLYVADAQNNSIRKVTPAGIVTTLAGKAGPPGNSDGVGTNAFFNRPGAVAVDAQTNVYVADFANNEIRKLTPSATNWTVTTLAGHANAAYAGAITNVTGGITNITTVISGSSLYTNYSAAVTNVSGGTTNVLIIITNTPSYTNVFQGNTNVVGLATNVFYLPPAPPLLDGSVANALFNHPTGITLDSANNLYVADGGTNGVRVITPGGVVSTLPGSAGAYTVEVNVFGTNQLFYRSSAAAVDGAGNVYVADAANVTIRKIAPGGVVATIAGSPGYSGVADGTNTTARFASPVGLTLDAQTNLFVVDALSHTIRKIAPIGSDWVVTTVGGWANIPGSEDGVGTSARFNGPGGIAMDSTGNLFIADTDNHTIRMGQAVAQSTPVALGFSLVGQQVILSWPASASGFHLVSSTSLASNASWLPVTNEPAVFDTNFVVTNDSTAASAFYRLRKP